MILLGLCLATMLAGQGGVAADSTARHPLPALRDTIGADVAGAGDSLVCRMEPYCPHVWPNTAVRFRVRVANHSSRTVYLVRPPTICTNRIYPRFWSRVEVGGGTAVSSGWGCFDTDWQTMRAEDFIRIAPGKQADLFDSRGYVEPAWRGSAPGRYVERFHYSTEENDLRAWLGSSDADTLSAEWRARFRSIPRVELNAACDFEVQQR